MTILAFMWEYVCLFMFIGCATWGIVTYLSDSDTCLVDFKLYNEKPSYRYPSISIMIINPFLDERLKEYGAGINAVTYSKFLAGQHWDERMLYIDYDNVTIDLNDYFIGYEMLSDNFSVIKIENFTDNPASSYGWRKPYRNFRAHAWQTFSIDPPFETFGGVSRFLVQTWIKIRTNLFQNSIRQSVYEYDPDSPNWGGFEVWFHYPNQLMQSWHLGMGKWFWPQRNENSSKNYEMVFERSKMEVMKRRNKDESPCVEDEINHDQHVIQEIMSKSRCRPPHWNLSAYPLCRSKEEMINVLPPLKKQEFLDYTPPCRIVTNMPFSFQELDEDPKRDPAYFRISMTSADTTFKLVELIKEYPLQKLMGNIGGFLGLFLGYGMIQLPIFFCRLYKKLYSLIKLKCFQTPLFSDT